jgi:hypothetical protein
MVVAGMPTRKRCRLQSAWLQKSVAGVGALGSLAISESARSVGACALRHSSCFLPKPNSLSVEMLPHEE